jgi:hypothetical protein
MDNQGDYGKQKEQVEQEAGYVTHQKAACPQNEQQQSYSKKRSKSHDQHLGRIRLLLVRARTAWNQVSDLSHTRNTADRPVL